MSFAWPWCFLMALPLGLAGWRMLRRGRRAGIKFAPVRRLPTKTAGGDEPARSFMSIIGMVFWRE